MISFASFPGSACFILIRYDNALITCISCFHIWYFRHSLHSILHQAIKAIHHELDEVDCIQSFCDSLILLVIWDEVPTMVEIAIFWFQIQITNGLNFMHRKWHSGNQCMVKSAENQRRSNLELLPVMNVKSRPRYISAQKTRHYFDALNEREIGR